MTLGEALFEIVDVVAVIVLIVGDDDCDSDDDDDVITPIVVCFDESEIMQLGSFSSGTSVLVGC